MDAPMGLKERKVRGGDGSRQGCGGQGAVMLRSLLRPKQSFLFQATRET